MKRSISDDSLHMEVIVNLKTLDNGTNVVQLEEAAGSAIKSFNNAIGKGNIHITETEKNNFNDVDKDIYLFSLELKFSKEITNFWQ